ncbi:MAG: zf-TFIIB domain-containing protein [Ignavibacteria bacterium]|nr:zf-TFIIB domain-containing protein [Ignavibacteria bacterium]
MKKCPVCEIIMNEVTKIDVLIDVCPKCMGIWLDKGELDRIIQKACEIDRFEYGSGHQASDYGEPRNAKYSQFVDDDDHHIHERYNGERHRHEKDGEIYYDRNGKAVRKKTIGGFLSDLFD